METDPASPIAVKRYNPFDMDALFPLGDPNAITLATTLETHTLKYLYHLYRICKPYL